MMKQALGWWHRGAVELPIYLAVRPHRGAPLAAGNRVLVKMSEHAPETGELFARLVASRFAPELLAVVNGADGARNLALPFDHLLFTGSTHVGPRAGGGGGGEPPRGHLELWRQSPAIVGRDIAIGEAADRILFSASASNAADVHRARLRARSRGARRGIAAAAQRGRWRGSIHALDNPDYTDHRVRTIASASAATSRKRARARESCSSSMPRTKTSPAPRSCLRPSGTDAADDLASCARRSSARCFRRCTAL
jgi:hypothetical protein